MRVENSDIYERSFVSPFPEAAHCCHGVHPRMRPKIDLQEIHRIEFASRARFSRHDTPRSAGWLLHRGSRCDVIWETLLLGKRGRGPL